MNLQDTDTIFFFCKISTHFHFMKHDFWYESKCFLLLVGLSWRSQQAVSLMTAFRPTPPVQWKLLSHLRSEQTSFSCASTHNSSPWAICTYVFVCLLAHIQALDEHSNELLWTIQEWDSLLWTSEGLHHN